MSPKGLDGIALLSKTQRGIDFSFPRRIHKPRTGLNQVEAVGQSAGRWFESNIRSQFESRCPRGNEGGGFFVLSRCRTGTQVAHAECVAPTRSKPRTAAPTTFHVLRKLLEPIPAILWTALKR